MHARLLLKAKRTPASKRKGFPKCIRGDAAAAKLADEIVTYASQKGVGFWKALGMLYQSIGAALTGKALNAIQKINSAINVNRSMGSTLYLPECLAHLANVKTGW